MFAEALAAEIAGEIDTSERAGLRAWRPLVSGLGTYKDGRYRLDWILISVSLQFEEYRVATDEISDHRPVIAVVRYQPAGAKR